MDVRLPGRAGDGGERVFAALQQRERAQRQREKEMRAAAVRQLWFFEGRAVEGVAGPGRGVPGGHHETAVDDARGIAGDHEFFRARAWLDPLAILTGRERARHVVGLAQFDRDAGTHQLQTADRFGEIDQPGRINDARGDLHRLALVGNPRKVPDDFLRCPVR